VLLYVRSVLQPVEFEPRSNFPEQVGCRILDSKGGEFYLGVCYRTPTDSIFGSGNHTALQELVTELAASRKHFMLVGDLNYSFKKWPLDADTDAPSEEVRQFIECLDDNFLTQHVTVPTRNNSILDLIITDEQHMIHDILDLRALDNSDHNTLQWRTHVHTKTTERTHQVFDNARADVADLKLEIQAFDWQHCFRDSSVEDNWDTFKRKLQELEMKYVPVKSVCVGKTKPMWMSY